MQEQLSICMQLTKVYFVPPCNVLNVLMNIHRVKQQKEKVEKLCIFDNVSHIFFK